MSEVKNEVPFPRGQDLQNLAPDCTPLPQACPLHSPPTHPPSWLQRHPLSLLIGAIPFHKQAVPCLCGQPSACIAASPLLPVNSASSVYLESSSIGTLVCSPRCPQQVPQALAWGAHLSSSPLEERHSLFNLSVV